MFLNKLSKYKVFSKLVMKIRHLNLNLPKCVHTGHYFTTLTPNKCLLFKFGTTCLAHPSAKTFYENEV